MSKINLQRGKLTVENRKSREKKKSRVFISSYIFSYKTRRELPSLAGVVIYYK